jgi:hypothetical protein
MGHEAGSRIGSDRLSEWRLSVRKWILSVAAIAAIVLAAACGRSEAPASGGKPAPSSPIGFLNTPAEGQAIAPGTFVSGWALDESGIADVSVTFDDGKKVPVRRGVDFPGVQAQHPNYPDADKAGYIFAIPTMGPGPHSLTVVVKAKNGQTTQILRRFEVR